ncbi:MAG: metallophosphoesterase [Myxococcales bacterium]|nr:MAG: metallophosphoesterase [Myxococcales bacterium]
MACVAALSWGFLIEPGRLVVRYEELPLPRWPRPLSGMKVAFLSDLHVGAPFWGVEQLSTLVERTNAEQPELILLGGDYLVGSEPGGTRVPPDAIAERLGALHAPLGVVAVLGNHDWDDGDVRRAFERRGIRVLEDEALRLQRAHQEFWIVGLADQITQRSEPRKAASKVPKSSPYLLLVHEPDIFESFGRLGLAPALTLAGHTHGGQVWLPLVGRAVVPSEFGRRYAYGHVVENGRNLFVTSGVGTSILPVRFLVPPEITILTLR